MASATQDSSESYDAVSHQAAIGEPWFFSVGRQLLIDRRVDPVVSESPCFLVLWMLAASSLAVLILVSLVPLSYSSFLADFDATIASTVLPASRYDASYAADVFDVERQLVESLLRAKTEVLVFQMRGDFETEVEEDVLVLVKNATVHDAPSIRDSLSTFYSKRQFLDDRMDVLVVVINAAILQ